MEWDCYYVGSLLSPKADVPTLGCLAPIVINVINIAFAFLGVLTVLFLIWGAIKFVISRGDQKALQSAKNTMTYTIIAAVFVALSFVIINFVTNILGLPSVLTGFTLFQP